VLRPWTPANQGPSGAATGAREFADERSLDAECVAARWWAAAAFGYSRRGMKAPRTAHWLVVPTLALGMAMAPVRAHAAPAPGDERPTGEPGEARSKTYKLPKSKPSEPPSDAPAAKTDDAPTGEAEGSPDAAAGTTPAPEAETPPDTGTPPVEPTETPATETPATETPPEPAITVQPRLVEPSAETSPAPTNIASREVVVDPRRLRSDDRILFRAGILSLGVAAAAVVPTVVGFQQAYVAHVDDDPARERTMRGLGIGAGVAAGTYVITGIVLMSLGARQRRAALAPAVGPGQLGAVLRARF
jgi:hypothetical protein